MVLAFLGAFIFHSVGCFTWVGTVFFSSFSVNSSFLFSITVTIALCKHVLVLGYQFSHPLTNSSKDTSWVHIMASSVFSLSIFSEVFVSMNAPYGGSMALPCSSTCTLYLFFHPILNSGLVVNGVFFLCNCTRLVMISTNYCLLSRLITTRCLTT